MRAGNHEESSAPRERAILAAVCSGDTKEQALLSLEELRSLAQTAGAECVGEVVQSLEQINPATYLGKGKLAELERMAFEEDADLIICDDELSPAQLANISGQLTVRVVDRTLLILDIFAARAATSEGKIQVELAQMNYRLSHLAGMGRTLSRQGGGIGTRGPGEKKLETDRRRIRARMARLRRDLEDVRRHRQLLRSARAAGTVPVVAIVGYTNAGKSTLLNALSGSDVYTQDQLFATLDPTTRTVYAPGGMEMRLTDTVGFIRKLPHQLVDAFRSTLEETAQADVILHVADSSSPQMEEQMQVVYETLQQLGVKGKPVVIAFNKQDLADDRTRLTDPAADRAVRISAKTGEGLDALKEILEEVLTRDLIRIEREYPYDQAGKVELIRKHGKLLRLEYEAEKISLTAYVPAKIYGRV